MELRFKVNVSTSGAPFCGQLGITSHIMFLLDGKFEVVATPEAVATAILWAPLDFLCSGTCFIFLTEFSDSGSGKTLTPL